MDINEKREVFEKVDRNPYIIMGRNLDIKEKILERGDVELIELFSRFSQNLVAESFISVTFTKLIISALTGLVVEKCTDIYQTVKATLARWLKKVIDAVGNFFSKIADVLLEFTNVTVKLFSSLLGVNSDTDDYNIS